MAGRIATFDAPQRQGFGKHELVRELMPYRLWKYAEDLATFNTPEKALCLGRYPLFSIEKDIRVQDTQAALGNLIQILY